MDPITAIDQATAEAERELRAVAEHVAVLEGQLGTARAEMLDMALALRPRIGTKRVADACGTTEGVVRGWDHRRHTTSRTA